MQNWKFAISSIMGHKMRSFLTMVGIIIGVASVVVIMALGDGMKAGVTKTFTKDQQYVQISYSARKKKVVVKAVLLVNETKECHRQLAMERKVARTLTIQSLKHHPLFKKNGSKN